MTAVASNVRKPEEWRPVKGWEGRYDVSDRARIRCWFGPNTGRLKTPRIRTMQKNKNGYNFIVLYDGDRRKGGTVGRMMLMAFQPTNDPKMECSHIDGDKTNDTLSNLCWETRQQNEDRKKIHGTRPRGETAAMSSLKEADIHTIIDMWKRGIKRQVMAKRFGVTESCISAVTNGKAWNHVTNGLDMSIPAEILYHKKNFAKFDESKMIDMYANGVPVEEIARVCGITVATIYNRLEKRNITPNRDGPKCHP